MHQFWLLATNKHRTTEETMLLEAIVILSLWVWPSKRLEEVYDLLHSKQVPNFSDVRTPLEQQLDRMEKIIMASAKGIDRVQADDQGFKEQLTRLQSGFNTLLQTFSSVSDQVAQAETRLENDIAALRNADPGNEAALNAVADSMDQTKQSFSTLGDTLDTLNEQMTSLAQAQQGVDVPVTPPPPPPPPTTLAIDPTSVSMLRTETHQFTANIEGSIFRAQSGTIDGTGMYTPPDDPSIQSDTVTATSPDGTQTASASVSISQ